MKGYSYTILSGFLLTGSVVLNKHLLNFMNSRMLAFLFFATVFLSSAAILAFRYKHRYLKLIKNHWKDGLITGGFNGAAATFFFMSLELLDASTTAFLVRFSTVFIIIIGVFYLKDRITRLDLLGICIAVLGAFVINFSVVSFGKLGLIAALTAAMFIALHQVAAKMFVKRTAAFTLVNLRTMFSSTFLLVIALGTSSFHPIPVSLIPLFLASGILAGAGFGFFYKSLETIEVSKGAVVRSLDPFMVLLYGFFLFGTLPSLHEIFGGILIILGVVIIILKRRLTHPLSFLRRPTSFG